MESNPEATPGSGDAGAQAAAGIASSMGRMTDFVGQFARVASAEACVGPAHTANGHTVMTVASVSLQAGFGLGFGGDVGGAEQGQGSGGGGGGGRGGSRAIAVVDISDAGVSVRPVPDVTSLALGLLALLGLRLLVGRGGGGAAADGLAAAGVERAGIVIEGRGLDGLAGVSVRVN